MPDKDRREYYRQHNRKRRQDPVYKEREREWIRQRRENPEFKAKERKQQVQYETRRYKNDEDYHRLQNLRSRMRKVLKGSRKADSTLNLCGCTAEFLKAHLQTPNDGQTYHIDHVRPCTTFNLEDPMHQRVCFHWTNLQMLTAEENLKKGADWNPLKYGGLRLHIAQVEALHTGNLDVLNRLFMNQPVDSTVSSVDD